MWWVLFNIVILEFRTPYIQIVYESFISGNLLISELEQTSRDNSSWRGYVTHGALV